MNAQSPSTALTSVEPAHPRVAALSAGAVAAIVPQTFDDVFRFSQVLSRSGLCPYGMDTPEKVSVAILTGLEVGVKPMQAVQGIAVIGGRPCIWGDLALALVRSSPVFEYIKETYEGTPPKNWAKPEGDELRFKAICVVKRKGEPEAEPQEFSIADAIQAELWMKRGSRGPTPWVTNPKRMLKMRSRGFSLRDNFTDVLKGMPIAEELIGNDAEDAEFNDAPPPPPPAATIAPPAPPPAEAAKTEIEDATILSETAAGAPPPSQPAAKGAEASTSNPPAVDASASNGFGPDDINPDDEIGNLIDKLAHAKDEATLEEWYVETDIEAALSGFDGYVEKARNVRDQQTERVRKLAAADQPAEGAAPPPPPADGLDDDAPPPPASGPDLSTIDGYQRHLQAQLDAAKMADDFASIRTWWSDTRALRNDLDMPQEKRVELQGLFEARKKALGL